jgi:hypothetical protein
MYIQYYCRVLYSSTSSLRVWEFVVELYVCSFPIELFRKKYVRAGAGALYCITIAISHTRGIRTRHYIYIYIYIYRYARIGMCVIIVRA